MIPGNGIAPPALRSPLALARTGHDLKKGPAMTLQAMMAPSPPPTLLAPDPCAAGDTEDTTRTRSSAGHLPERSADSIGAASLSLRPEASEAGDPASCGIRRRFSHVLASACFGRGCGSSGQATFSDSDSEAPAQGLMDSSTYVGTSDALWTPVDEDPDLAKPWKEAGEGAAAAPSHLTLGAQPNLPRGTLVHFPAGGGVQMINGMPVGIPLYGTSTASGASQPAVSFARPPFYPATAVAAHPSVPTSMPLSVDPARHPLHVTITSPGMGHSPDTSRLGTSPGEASLYADYSPHGLPSAATSTPGTKIRVIVKFGFQLLPGAVAPHGGSSRLIDVPRDATIADIQALCASAAGVAPGRPLRLCFLLPGSDELMDLDAPGDWDVLVSEYDFLPHGQRIRLFVFPGKGPSPTCRSRHRRVNSLPGPEVQVLPLRGESPARFRSHLAGGTPSQHAGQGAQVPRARRHAAPPAPGRMKSAGELISLHMGTQAQRAARDATSPGDGSAGHVSGPSPTSRLHRTAPHRGFSAASSRTPRPGHSRKASLDASRTSSGPIALRASGDREASPLRRRRSDRVWASGSTAASRPSHPSHGGPAHDAASDGRQDDDALSACSNASVVIHTSPTSQGAPAPPAPGSHSHSDAILHSLIHDVVGPPLHPPRPLSHTPGSASDLWAVPTSRHTPRSQRPASPAWGTRSPRGDVHHPDSRPHSRRGSGPGVLPPATPGRRDEGDWQRKDASRLGRHVRHRSLEAVGEWRAGAGDGNEGDDDEPEWQEQMGDVAGKGSEEEAGGNEGVVGTGVHDFNVKALEHLLQLRQEHLNRKNQHLLRRRPRNRLFTMNQLLPPATADQGLFSIEEERSFSLSFGRGGHYVDLDGPAGLGGGSSVSGRRRSSGSDGGLAGGVAQRTAENSAAQKVQSTVLGDMLARVREMVASAKGGEEGEGGEGHVPHDTASTLAVGSPGPVEAQGPATDENRLEHTEVDKTATARGRRQWREDAPTRGTTELSLFDLPEPLPPHPALHEVLGLTLPEPSGTPATEAVRGVGQAWAEEPAGATAPRAGGGDGSGFVSDETEERKRGVEEACGEGREDADAKPGWRPPRLMLMGSGGGGSGVGGGGGGGGLSLFGGAADEWEEEAAHGRGGERGGRPMVMVGSQAPVGRWTTEGWEEEEPIAEPEVPSTLQQIPPGDLTRVQELGRGQFGAVWHQRWRGVDVAVKEMHNAGVVARTEMVREAATLATLRHPCVVGFYGVILSDGLAATVLEFVRHGNLRKALKGRVRRDAALMADPAALRRLRVAAALSAARGMEYLHSQSIVHFDLKADNLLCDLSDIANPQVKVGDLGLSKQKATTFVSGNMRGTLPWMAPELFGGMARESPADDEMAHAEDDGNVTEKVDVFSFGVTMWEIWTLGTTPYEDKKVPQVLQGVMSGTLRPGVPHDCDPGWADLMQQCWHPRASMRPSFSDICRALETLLDAAAAD